MGLTDVVRGLPYRDYIRALQAFGAESASELKKIGGGALAAYVGLSDDAAGIVSDLIEIRGDFFEAIEDDDPDLDNPSFIANGHEGSNAETQWYFRKQGWFKKAGFVGGVAGKVGGWFSGWNVYDMGSHGSAAYNAYSNLAKYKAMAANVRGGKAITKGATLAEKLEHLIKIKTTKLWTRGGEFAATTLPGSELIGSAAKVYRAMTGQFWETNTMSLAGALHYRAFVESRLARTAGKNAGPATRIVWQVFQDYTLMGSLIAEDWNKIGAILAEPKGWLVISHKLNAM